MRLLIVIFVVLIGSAVADDNGAKENSSDSNSALTKTTVQLIAENNYPVEIHHVTTKDGYILTMHRIPAAKGKPVVFLMHGLLLSSIDWVLLGRGKALAFLLADAGYDVWMGNARGNVYSKDHVNKSHLTAEKYWNFEWHEIGLYDLSAMIDYILESTGQKNLICIGHSQGPTTFFVLTSLRPDYNNKIKVMFCLGPVGYAENTRSPLLRLAATFTFSLQLFAEIFGIYEFKPTDKMQALAKAMFCKDEALTQGLCSTLYGLMFGPDQEQLNETALPTYLAHFPDGASTRQLLHYGQGIQSKKFRQYDYGLIENLIVYGSLSPPDYNLRAVTAPVHMMYGDNDWLADPKDVKKTSSELGNLIELYRIPLDKWNHMDFIWGIDAEVYVYDYILKTLKERYQ